MLYLFIDKNRVEILYLKKSILGQYETRAFSKLYPSSNLLTQGRVTNVDLIASAAKEVVQSLADSPIKEKDILLILPQESYTFMRLDLPKDIALSAIPSFVEDKARSQLPLNLNESSYDFFIEEGVNEKYLHFFAVENETIDKFKQALNLIDLKLKLVLPESVTFFKLFQKTLRKDKKENIFFVSFEENQLTGLLYDSFGQLSSEKWTASLDDKKKVEEILKEKAGELEKAGYKLNRLILAGSRSENVRQDTFTKEIGVWTNPLKRIIPEFYQDYLKLLISSSNQPFSVLSNEACVGAFIFHEELKRFSLLNNVKGVTKSIFAVPRVNLFKKEFLIFIASFIFSFIFFFLLSKSNFMFNFNLKSSIPTPKAKSVTVKPKEVITPTPSPKFLKEEIKIKVLNGSGVVGKAGLVKELLKEKGYQEILTGNADSFDYEQTELQVKKSKSSLAEIIKGDLKGYVSKIIESTLDEDEASDAVIIIGADFE